MSILTQKQLKEELCYDPETGIFTWAKDVGWKRYRGCVAGRISQDGYRKISVHKKSYNASRLVWLYMEGYFPENDMDHKNRIRSDDRFCNLRHVSRSCNIRNSTVKWNNKSGITGVSWTKKTRRWRVQISLPNKRLHLGYFSSKKDAVRARWEAEVEHGFPNCNTISSAYLYLQENKTSAQYDFSKGTPFGLEYTGTDWRLPTPKA